MKTLVIVIHPNIEESVINKRWIEELNQYPENFTIHELHKLYPDEKIDIQAEQKLLEEHDKIVFQFPFYWFNSPPLFKKWLDQVLTYGWAYGSKSNYKMSGKKVALVISVGIDESDYQESGKYKYTLEELTRPFEVTFEYIKSNYKPLFAYYGIEQNSSDEWIQKSIPLYLNFLNSL
ncbi:NAD(P)H-dependent oxidoreductase [Flavobacterium johnsoniae]|uniref:NAD(P)H oxidoreductase n=1 Tax=Flavobacterium johnsoniae TaxID=986 RepID=A0A1J7BQ23_FLAJO|nr:NAD(P)H-dependent oxidoreductase [Flavobacterium johnsoniae]OIV40795.1 NAD(P)H oxidoreductase [Flavobacterium johnsoniae]